MESTIETEQPKVENLGAKKKFMLTPIATALIAGIMIAVTLGYLYRGIFIAATVDGTPVSRLSVIKELEKQGGAQALDTLITDVLLEKEFATLGVEVSVEDIDAEIKKIEEQVAAQGGTLEAALAQQGMTMEVLREQITVQKKLELALADKVAVTDEELKAHVEESGAVISEGEEGQAMMMQIKDELKQQKFQTEAQLFVTGLKDKATINRYVSY